MNTYTIHINKNSGVTLTIYDELTLDTYDDGSIVNEYSSITIICEVKKGYKLKTFTVNGVSYDQFVGILVTSDVYVVALADSSGVVYINPGSGFFPFRVLINSNYGWHAYMPFIFDGYNWRMSG